MRPVIFDMDGVLADSEGISCEVAAAVMSECGAKIDKEEVRQRFVGMSTPSMLKTVAAERRMEFPEDIQTTIRERCFVAYQNRLKPIEGMDEFLKSTAFARCVASSSSPPRIEGTLKTMRLYDTLAPHLFSATMVENGKPAPDLFLHAAKSMGWQPADCIVIEDSKAGVEAGRAAGMFVIGITAGEHLDHDEHAPILFELGAQAVVRNVAELRECLRPFGIGQNEETPCN